MSPAVLPAYGLQERSLKIESVGGGLINDTWKITTKEEAFILQKVNHDVFKKPDHIAFNIRLIADYLHQHYPQYHFVAPLSSVDGHELVHLKDEGFFRLFPFVADSHTRDVVDTPEQAYEAARQFGKFASHLASFDVNQLKITIPWFHDLALRYQQFLQAMNNAGKQRFTKAENLIRTLLLQADIVSVYSNVVNDPAFKLRVTHHDTKISNVLFNSQEKGICVIDLDTVMPGYFISDIGDMMRTYLSPVSEEESDFSKIVVREEFYKAIVQGYNHEMKEVLTEKEKEHFFYAGKFMIYMQALRFLTDYLNDDIYYGANYEDHNLVRAGNQACLLEKLIAKQDLVNRMI